MSEGLRPALWGGKLKTIVRRVQAINPLCSFALFLTRDVCVLVTPNFLTLACGSSGVVGRSGTRVAVLGLINKTMEREGGRGVFREVAFCAAVFGHLEKASLHASAIEEKEAKQSRRKREGGGE